MGNAIVNAHRSHSKQSPVWHGSCSEAGPSHSPAKQFTYTQLQQHANLVSNLRADADEFVPGGACAAPGFNACAAEFVPAAPTVSAPGFNAFAAEFVPAAPTVSNGFNVQASEFIPSECKIVEVPTTSIASCFNVQASEFVPSECNTVGADVQDVGLGFSGVAASNPNVLSIINPAFLSDDESDDESGDTIATIATIAKEKEVVTVADLGLYHMLMEERAEKSTV